MNITEIFREKMACDGIVTKEPIISDGELHRIHVEGDKAGSRNGWYVLYADRVPSGAFGSWKADISKRWCIKSHIRMTRNEWLEYRRKMEDAHHQRKQAKAYEHECAGKRARGIWRYSHVANLNHPYFVKKAVSPFSARQRGDVLVLPIMDFQNIIWSLQFIDANGSKFLLSGGAKKSNFIPVNGTLDSNPILICEGWATGATLATDNPFSCVIAAIDANNLEPVASKIRLYKPRSKIIICADDDRMTQGNPGQTKARQAAIVSGALLSSPQWPINAPESLTDFNDLSCWLESNKEVLA
jgi:putative DNA primase/helicase